MKTETTVKTAAAIVTTAAIGILALCPTLSCTYFAKLVAEDLASSRSTKLAREFRLPSDSSKRYLACLQSVGCSRADANLMAEKLGIEQLTEALATLSVTDRGLAVGTHAQNALRVLDSPMQRKLNAVFASLAVRPGSVKEKLPTVDGTPKLSFTHREVEDYLRALETATAANSWDQIAESLNPTGLSVAGNDKVLQCEKARKTAQYLQAYMGAYFQNGHFFQVRVDQAALKNALQQQYPWLTDASVASLLSAFPPEGFGSIANTGFVTRGGRQYSCPSVVATLTPFGPHPIETGTVDLTQVGSNLIRVFLHALFDAEQQLPAVSNATGVKLGQKVNDPAQGGLSQADFGKVEEISDQIEAVVSVGVGRLVRGLGWVSLNNEALASTIETLVGVTVRKGLEKLVWCHYSSKQVLSDPTVKAASFDEMLPLTIEISGQ
jgi:hypothetical protein